MEQAYEKYHSGYNEEIEREISYFMSKRRRQVVETLYDKKRLSQGELAKAVNTSAASLSNILLNFEMFQYQLLGSESEGKRRYYFLTDLGKKFVQSAYRNKQSAEFGNVVFHESFQGMQSITSCLEAVKSKYHECWEVALDIVLHAGIEWRETQIDDDEKEIEPDDDWKEIDAFLYSVERMLLDDFENYSVRIVELFYSNQILYHRWIRFITIFEVFIPVLKMWKQKIDSLQMYNFLESIVTCDRDKAEPYIRQLQWEDKQFDRLSELMQKITERTEKNGEFEIYRYFNRFLAGEEMLGAILAKEICAARKKMKEKIHDEEKR